jgi:hypothetical protein
MTNVAIVKEQKALSPFSFSYENDCQSTYTASNDTNSYATELACILAKAQSEDVFRQYIHVTFSQRDTEFPTVFVFKFGVPSIDCKPPRSDWVDLVLQFSLAHQEDNALKEIARTTTRVKAGNEFSKLSTDLLSLNLKKLPDIVLVGLLRNTFSIRSRISCWSSLRDQIEQLLLERKRDPRLLLRGLKK